MEIKLEGGTWTVGDPLVNGNGGFGAVFEARSADISNAVAKFVPKDPGAERELLIGDSLNASQFHNVVPVIDRGEHLDSWVIVMPRADKSLAEHIAETGNELDLSEAVAILSDIATALSDIDETVVHRDLKPQNVLLLGGSWCLADFGIARYAAATTAYDTRKFSLTPMYAAPEQWRSEHATSATDIYAFGIIAYQLLSGGLPFKGPDTASFRQQHLEDNPPKLTAGTARLRILVEECLYKAPQARPGAKNILARLANSLHETTRPGMSRLAQVSHSQVQHEAKTYARELALREEEDSRARIFEAAMWSFKSFSEPLLQAITDNAPIARIDVGAGRGKMKFVAELAGVRLGISEPEKSSTWDGPFDVIAFANIAINLGAQSRRGWEGRSHSLWFCDAVEKGRFGWYEMAFMGSPLMNSGHSIEPFSCSPQEATIAFQSVIGTMQLAWPVEELDRADPSDFFDRWLGWFADAAEHRLDRPSTMPEKQTTRFWRRE
ncbi:serine/threonine-protein kinase [Propionibacterium freudenreichii]|uniref:serine/threonine-protein kinase n=1 Tax=Propionibacterium freudenreichii TaxID=1744 RepID=UPI002549F34D|nr:serine/threonine-protein kinase [Propionibacterium freudenreichii]MDK9640948.1 serine/threonine protein kinase [Propionibacterium freudenreichii]